ncbi:MAG: N-acetylmannosamine-6-phosphate 2-epimerase [Bacilli bacterium]
MAFTGDVVESLRGGLIVSCQALPGEPLYGPEYMAVMALAAQQGGAVGIRANTPEDITAIRRVCSLPMIGIYKRDYDGSPVYITPTMKEVDEIVVTGAEIVAIDATSGERPSGASASAFIRDIKRRHDILVMADVSTVDEGLAAMVAGADVVSTTMAGYTPQSVSIEGPAFDLLMGLVSRSVHPVICEGRIGSPEECAKAFQLGAYAVVVGSAITRPQDITRVFAKVTPKMRGVYEFNHDCG